jgi:8-oxo-dGTP diphosphatase
MVQVVAAILERNGRILIGQRQPTQSHALQWEFPGGKVEPGETAPQALARELQEELDIQDAAGPEIMRYQYTYSGKNPIELIFFRVTQFQGEPRNLIFHEMRWESPRKLVELHFVEGDTTFLKALVDGRV